MEIDWLGLVSRWFHILAAMIAVGGTIFQRAAVVPALGQLGDADRDRVAEAMRSRWSKFVAAAILFLLVSGLYNFITIINRYDLPRPWYHALFGVKFLLALAIFFIASLLAGRSDAAKRFRRNAPRWLSLNVALAVILVMISGALKVMPHTPKTDRPAAEVGARAEPAVEATRMSLPRS